MLLEHIQQKGFIPAGTKTWKVKAVLQNLVLDLADELDRPMIWLATCSVAVNAGYQKATKRKRKRTKLLERINICRAYLSLEPITPPDESWLERKLYYGYGVTAPGSKYEEDFNRSAVGVQLLATLSICSGADTRRPSPTQTDLQEFLSGVTYHGCMPSDRIVTDALRNNFC